MFRSVFRLATVFIMFALFPFAPAPLYAVASGIETHVSLPLLYRAPPPRTVQAIVPHTGFPNLDPKVITFASPSVVDINGDGALDILIGDGAGCVWGWDRNGQRLAGFPWKTVGSCDLSTRIGTSLAIGDIDRDGKPEVVAGTRGTGTTTGQRGRTYVWRRDGTLLPGWPKEMDWNPTANGGAEVYGVALANVAGDARLEVLAGTSNNSTDQALNNPLNLYAWNVDGTLLPGYPTIPTSTATAGIFGMIGAADLNRDGYAEVITGRDHSYVYATGPSGQPLSGWPVRTYVDPNKASYSTDRYIEFTHNPPAMGDLDGDGTVEVVIAGKVRDPAVNRSTTSSAVVVLEPNGQRRPGWTIPPLGGAPLYNDNLPNQAPALADLDGDGKLEIVVALFDGTIRAYRENGVQLWKYDFAQGKTLFGSEPVIGDVTGDGRLDIVFGTYSPDGSANAAARVIGLDAQGRPLSGFPLPLGAEGTSAKQGIRAAPTLTDIDGNGTVELIVGSQGGTIYMWDLAVPYRSELMPWPTGRHDNLRSGTTVRTPNTNTTTPSPTTTQLPATATTLPSPTATQLPATATVLPSPTTLPSATATVPPSPTPATTTTVKSITFENAAGKLTDVATGADTVVGSVLIENTAPLKGSYSARIANTENGYLQEDFTPADSLSVSFFLRITSAPASTRILVIRNNDKTIGNIQLTTDRQLYLRNYEARIGASSAPLALNTLYRVAVYQQRGSGANGVLSAYIAEGDAAFAEPFATSLTQTFTTSATSIRIGATNSRSTDIVVDDIIIDNARVALPSNGSIDSVEAVETVDTGTSADIADDNEDVP